MYPAQRHAAKGIIRSLSLVSIRPLGVSPMEGYHTMAYPSEKKKEKQTMSDIMHEEYAPLMNRFNKNKQPNKIGLAEML